MSSSRKTNRFLRSAETRARILAAARVLFTVRGYHGTTIRAVAAEADIHPSMVMRYFESKDGLFAAAAEFDLRLPDLSDVKPADLGVTLVRQFLDRWEGTDAGDELPALLGAAPTNAVARERLADVFKTQIEPMIARAIQIENKEQCAALIVSQMLGLAFTRYILRLPAVVSLPREVIEREVGATIQNYLMPQTS